MHFETFGNQHIEEATELVMKNTRAEIDMVPSLPDKDYTQKICSLLTKFAGHSMGVAGIDDGKLVSFMTGHAPIDELFGKDKGIYIPLHAHGAVRHHQEKLYSLMYQEASRRWAKEGLTSHSITIFAHNKELLDWFSWNGFGYRCVDSVSGIKEVGTRDIEGCSFRLGTEADYVLIYPLYVDLCKHLYDAPTFLVGHADISYENFLAEMTAKNGTILLAEKDDQVVGYMEYCDHGENFMTSDPRMANICGAYLKPAYRGSGIFTALLATLYDHLREKGYNRCGVDFESFNPTARGFWNKYFTPYTISVTRRVDERIVNLINS